MDVYLPLSTSRYCFFLVNTEFLLCSRAEAESGPGLIRGSGWQHAHALQKLLHPLPETQHFFVLKVPLWLPWFPGGTGVTLLSRGWFVFQASVVTWATSRCRELCPMAQAPQGSLGCRDFAKITPTLCVPHVAADQVIYTFREMG